MYFSIKDSFGLMILAGGVSHYSPLVPNHLQANTSNIYDVLNNLCHSDALEDCDLDYFYDALVQFRSVISLSVNQFYPSSHNTLVNKTVNFPRQSP